MNKISLHKIWVQETNPVFKSHDFQEIIQENPQYRVIEEESGWCFDQECYADDNSSTSAWCEEALSWSQESWSFLAAYDVPYHCKNGQSWWWKILFTPPQVFQIHPIMMEWKRRHFWRWRINRGWILFSIEYHDRNEKRIMERTMLEVVIMKIIMKLTRILELIPLQLKLENTLK